MCILLAMHMLSAAEGISLSSPPTHNITFRKPVPLGQVAWGVTMTANFDRNGKFIVVSSIVEVEEGGRGSLVLL